MEGTETSPTVTDSPAPATPVVESSAVASTARPSSMREAFEQTAEKHADSTGAGTTDQTAQAAGLPASTPGPIPFDVHKTALENARTKTVAEVEQKYEWTKAIDQKTHAEMTKWYQRAAQDPAGFFAASILEHPQAVEIVQNVLGQMHGHAVHGQRLQSIVGSQLAKGRGQHAPEQAIDLNPIAVELADGRVIQVHTAEQAAAREQQLIAQQDQKYATALQTATELKQERAQLAAEAGAATFATDFLKDVRQLPNFGAHEATIKADLADLIQAGTVGDHPAELRDAVRSLYLKHALPSLSQSAQAQQLASLKQKAVAQVESTSSTASTPGTRPKTPAQLAAWMRARASRG